MNRVRVAAITLALVSSWIISEPVSANASVAGRPASATIERHSTDSAPKSSDSNLATLGGWCLKCESVASSQHPGMFVINWMGGMSGPHSPTECGGTGGPPPEEEHRGAMDCNRCDGDALWCSSINISDVDECAGGCDPAELEENVLSEITSGDAERIANALATFNGLKLNEARQAVQLVASCGTLVATIALDPKLFSATQSLVDLVEATP